MKKITVRSWYYHTPARDHRDIFHSVWSAGRIRLAPDYLLRSWAYPGHDLLLCVDGKGSVQIANRSFKINAGEVIWANNQHHDVQWPSRQEPWEFFWIRVDSAQMDMISEALNVESNPVFVPPNTAAVAAVFNDIIKLLRDRPMTIDAALHAAVSSLIAILFEARATLDLGEAHEAQDNSRSPDLSKVLGTMKAEYWRQWKIKDLAELMSLSEPQFFRRFRQATGSSPMDWLRRERVNHAKRRLAETQDHIRVIAEKVGYKDPYYFSRDFSKMVGVSPRQYRRHEQARAASGAVTDSDSNRPSFYPPIPIPISLE